MSAGFENDSAPGERLSALLDGEADGAASAAACAGWKVDVEVRRTWHAWHLIGDVLRSEDLASSAVRDQRFLLALRERLAVEPVVLAPAPLPSTVPALPRGAVVSLARRSSGRWMLPSAIAAGFMLVVGTFVVVRPGGVPAPAIAVAGNDSAAASPLREVSIRESSGAPGTVVVNGKLIRDAQLDRYLAAHKQFAGSSALGVPSAFLRSATVDAEPR